MDVNVSKLHGMTSDKAWRVKTRGNRKEDIFADLIKGIVLKGTKKPDVMNAYRQFFSVKGSSEKQGGEGRDGRIQVFMYNPSRFEKEQDFPAGSIIKDIFACYPPTHQEYQEYKAEIKEKISEHMIRLKEFLLDDENRAKFLYRAFFDRKMDFLVVYDDEIFHIFDKDEVWQVFLKYLEVDNSSTNQKVVFKYGNIVAEIEMRTTDDGKYPTIFMPLNKRIMFNLLLEKIANKKELSPYLWLYGNAIKKYKYVKKKF
ncbi:MAG: hypothetical protein U9Q06_00635 [Nanoarchaeota archaeon]|nr:hypothetical protein [Nanoarchaeota archaeon]